MRARGIHGAAGMKEPRKSAPSKSQPKPEEKLDEELEESFLPATRRPTRRRPPAAPKGRRRSLPSPTSRRDEADPGRAAIARCLRATEQAFDLVFGVNLRGAIFTVQRALPLMREGGSTILIGRQWPRPEQGVRHLLREQNGDPQPRPELDAGPQGAGIRVNVFVPPRSLLDLQKSEPKQLKKLTLRAESCTS